MIADITIVGGGTAGWMSAALLAKSFGGRLRITLIESEQIGAIGVGEATIPPIIHFNEELGLDFNEFIRETKATIKLGIQFENWGAKGKVYMHAFGDVGKSFPLCDFSHFFVKARQHGLDYDFWDFSLNYQTAKRNAFAPLDKIPGLNLPGLIHAYHFDAGLYAQYLRRYSEARGVRRVEGIITGTLRCGDSGAIKGVRLEDGSEVGGDLFIDCSGLRGLLIEQALNTGYEDWSHWLPADSAVAVPSESTAPLTPYTRAIAHNEAWQWRIPLQHRTGNGIVYCSKYLSDDQATETLLANLDGKPLAEPRKIRFTTGRRRRQWNKNVVSIGLSSGFLEPLESTSIHLIQSAIVRLIKMFPHTGISQSVVDEYNRQSRIEFEKIRDFIILHYWLTTRDDSQFWRDCQNLEVPDSLRHKREVFRASGQVYRESDELFTKIAWQQVFIGQGLLPEDYHGIVDQLDPKALDEMLSQVKAIITKVAGQVPPHERFLQQLK